MHEEITNAPPRPRYHLPPGLARACAHLDYLLAEPSGDRELSPEEYARACREIYGIPSADDSLPGAEAGWEPEPPPPPPRKLPTRPLSPALARSAARLEALLASPTTNPHPSVAEREAAIREIYGLPPE